MLPLIGVLVDAIAGVSVMEPVSKIRLGLVHLLV
jgi:hypothetical protein